MINRSFLIATGFLLLGPLLSIAEIGIGKPDPLPLKNIPLSKAFEQARYAPRPIGDATRWRMQNPAHGLKAIFSPEGMSLSVTFGGDRGIVGELGMYWRTERIGYGNDLSSLTGGTVVAEFPDEGNRLEIRRPGLVEWYVNNPNGLEHGYSLQNRPQGGKAGNPLRIEMRIEGDLSAEVAPDGQNVILRDNERTEILRYEKLKVYDAAGSELTSRMKGGGEILALEVDDSQAVYPLLIDPVFTQSDRLTASNAGSSDSFGESVAIDGDTVIVGAPFEDGGGTGANPPSDEMASDAGAAYIFVWSNGQWSEQAYLKASNPGNSDWFGHSVAISGDTVVISAPLEGGSATGVNGPDNNDAPASGAAYVFVRNGGIWTQQAYLKASNTDNGDQFGESVAISGDSILVGAPREASDTSGVNGASNENASEAGAAYLFVRNGETWSEQAFLKSSAPDATDWFGTSVAISGDTALVGAWFEDGSATTINGAHDNLADSAGAAYVFVRNGTTWSQQAYLKSSNIGENDWFGYSVSISEDTALVGAYGEDSSATGVNGSMDENMSKAGAAYVFTRNGTVWSEEAYLKASNTGADDNFGKSTSICGDMAIVGAPREAGGTTVVNGPDNDDAFLAGAAYTFLRSNGAWSAHSYLKAPNTAGFGSAVACSGDISIVATPSQSSEMTDSSGAAYLFELGPVPAILKLSKLRRFPRTTVRRKSRPQNLRLTNIGELPLTGISVRARGSAARDFIFKSPPSQLAPGASKNVRVTFRPRKTGIRKARLKVRSNSPEKSQTLVGKGK